MNRQAREDFGFWASEDYALMGKSGKGKVGKKKKGKRGKGGGGRDEGTDMLVNKGIKGLSSASRGGSGFSLPSIPDDPCGCTIS